EAFDVEPTFPLSLFEELIVEIESSLCVTPSCKVEGSRLLGGRFEVCPFQKKSWPQLLTHTFKFLDKIENRLGVRINRDSFEQFAGAYIGSGKIMDNTIGVHLGSKLEDSSVMMYIHFDTEQDCEELARTAIALDGGHYSDELTQVLIRDMTVISFELFFDGRSHMELGPVAPARPGELGNRGKYLTPYIQKYFSQKVNSIFRESYALKISFSKAYATPVLGFYFKNIKDIPKYFRFNSLGDRIFGFYQSQSCILYNVVVVTEPELENSRLENFYLYYIRSEEC
ncbi:MAG TPA: microcyclamide biosynthesis protein, partial [Cyanobacteria bacterium UBA11148]|nr:microcyclamide biosynthesis protein [Cyanobacteria bacterium UBA11148]